MLDYLFDRNNDIGTVLSLPTYDYKCEECGSEFELRLRFSDSGNGMSSSGILV